MRITKTALVGVAVVFAGLAVLAGRMFWSRTRTWVLVDMPISLSEGRIRTPEFKTNLTAVYLIEIEVEKNMPFDTINCLLGIESDNNHPDKCTNNPSVISASWILSRQGIVVARGSTAATTGGDWGTDTIARRIGSFKSEKGRMYE